MAYTHLTEGERYQIHALLRQGLNHKTIAAQLERHPSTISREVRRNRSKTLYYPRRAQQLSQERRVCNARRIDEATWREVEERLRSQEWLSPEQIAGRLKQEGLARISHETIYRRLYADKRAGGDGWKWLRCQKKKRKRYAGGQDRRGHIAGRRMIDERPQIVTDRGRLGDWEGDTIIGAQQRHALVSLVERRSQYLVLRKVGSRAAREVSQSMVDGLFRFNGLLESMTVDNGKEFASFKTVDAALGITTYFAHPYRSWERGLNEQINGKIRDYFPKKLPFDGLTQADCDRVADALNNRPRKTLGYRTPREEMIRLAALQGIALRI